VEWLAAVAFHLGMTASGGITLKTKEQCTELLASSYEFLAALPKTEERQRHLERLRWEVPLRRGVPNTLYALLQSPQITSLGADTVDQLTRFAIYECRGQWSVGTHLLFPPAVRRRAVGLFFVGQQLGACFGDAISSAFVGSDGLWVMIVLPYLVQ
jgi:hypothetical protein